ncbi:MAG: hypothetical protein Q9170_001600 [Blastenia crenularia]
MPSLPPPLVVALSGLSSTGKSTIASHLPSIFSAPRYAVSVLHVDDFYRPQSELPLREELLDWDCVESLDWPRLESAVQRWRGGEKVAEGEVNPQPEIDGTAANGVKGGITEALMEELRSAIQSTQREIKACQRILILDGFLLFTLSVPSAFRSLLDLKILLCAPYAEAKRRREARSRYTTMEGWWEDPPGYFDKVVWPNYVEENKGFFIGGDVEWEADGEVCERENVRVCKGKEGGLGEVLKWLVRELSKVLVKSEEEVGD